MMDLQCRSEVQIAFDSRQKVGTFNHSESSGCRIQGFHKLDEIGKIDIRNFTK